MIGPVRRESSTVVVLVGAVTEPLLAGLARSSNVSLVRPPGDEQDSLTAAALALGQAARRRSPYVLVPADPLAGVAAEWAAMWDLTAGPGHAAAFEQRAAEAVAAGRAGRFELPDYYVVLTPGAGPGDAADAAAGAHPDRETSAGDGTGMYLGPLRAAAGSGPWWARRMVRPPKIRSGFCRRSGRCGTAPGGRRWMSCSTGPGTSSRAAWAKAP